MILDGYLAFRNEKYRGGSEILLDHLYLVIFPCMLADDGNGLISFTPITTVLAGGSVIVFPVGFCIAISIIGFPGLEFTSTW